MDGNQLRSAQVGLILLHCAREAESAISKDGQISGYGAWTGLPSSNNLKPCWQMCRFDVPHLDSLLGIAECQVGIAANKYGGSSPRSLPYTPRRSAFHYTEQQQCPSNLLTTQSIRGIRHASTMYQAGCQCTGAGSCIEEVYMRSRICKHCKHGQLMKQLPQPAATRSELWLSLPLPVRSVSRRSC